MRRWTLIALGWLACTTLMWPPVPAVATSCSVAGAPPANPYALHPLLFVGTVVSTSHGDRVARVRVEDVWRGADVPAEVELVGSPEALTPAPAGMAVASSDDRHYAVGERYLFAPHGDSGAPGGPPAAPPRLLNYAGCDFLTRPYEPALEAFRPGPAAADAPTSIAAASPVATALPVAGGAARVPAMVVALLLGTALLLRRAGKRSAASAVGYR